MAIGEELSVKVDAATADFTASMERVEDKLEEVADESNSTSRSFGRLSASTSGLTASMGVLGTGLTATAIPAFLTLSTILAPLTVVIGGLAAATASLGAVFGGLALAGVVTHTSELQSALQEARQEIIQIIQPLGEVFGPLLVDAVEALPSLVQAIVNSLGPLNQFRSSLIEMGNTARRLIPQVTAVMFDLAERALPILNQALSALEGQGPGIFRELANVFNQMLPLVVNLGSAIADLLPDVLEFGTTVANLVLPALTGMANQLGNVISRVNELRPGMSSLVASAVILAPILSTLGSLLAALSAPVLVVVGALAALGAAYETNIFGFKDSVDSTVPSLQELERIGTRTFNALARTGRDIRRMLTPALRGLTNFINQFLIPAFRFAFNNVIQPVGQRVIALLSKRLNPLVSELGATFVALQSHAETLGKVMRVVWNQIDVVVTPIVGELADLFSVVLVNALDIAINSFELLLNIIQLDFVGALQNASAILGSFTDIALGVPASIIEAFGKGLIGMGTLLFEWVMGGANFLRRASGEAFEGLKEGARTLAGALEDAFAAALDLGSIAVDAVTEMGDAFASAVGNIASDIAEVGTEIANMIVDAINDAIPNGFGFSVGEIEIAGRTIVEAQTVSVGIPNNPVPSAQTGAFIEESGLLNVHEGERVVPSAQVSDRGTVNVEGSGPTEVMVTVEGDTGVIRDVSTQVVEERERRAKRRTGGSTQI